MNAASGQHKINAAGGKKAGLMKELVVGEMSQLRVTFAPMGMLINMMGKTRRDLCSILHSTGDLGKTS